MPRKTITRILTLHPGYHEETDDTYAVGDRVCLVTSSDGDNYLTKEPRTNQSRQLRWKGWLGTTNGISQTAHGRWEIRSMHKHYGVYDTPTNHVDWDQKYRIRLARITED